MDMSWQCGAEIESAPAVQYLHQVRASCETCARTLMAAHSLSPDGTLWIHEVSSGPAPISNADPFFFSSLELKRIPPSLSYRNTLSSRYLSKLY